MAIWQPLDKFHPAYGRVDGVVYYGGVPVAQPMLPSVWDPTGIQMVYWDSATSSWLPISVQDSQLSVDVVLAPAGVLPALDGSALINLPGPAALQAGSGGLNGAGQLVVNLTNNAANMVVSWANGITGAGQLTANSTGPSQFQVSSSAGAVDAGLAFYYITYG